MLPCRSQKARPVFGASTLRVRTSARPSGGAFRACPPNEVENVSRTPHLPLPEVLAFLQGVHSACPEERLATRSAFEVLLSCRQLPSDDLLALDVLRSKGTSIEISKGIQ